MASQVLPVFIKNSAIPNGDSDRPKCIDICVAAERVSGRETVLGAQNIKGLWRIYPASTEARNTLLVKGLSLRGVSLQVAGTNPFILRNETGEEKPSTKVWVDDIPISVADSEIETALIRVGVELRSAIKQERARDVDGKLTRFLTGRRFVFITTPNTPLEKTLKVSFFTAKVYHREQNQKKTVICSKCLETGHHVSMCQGDVVCRTCKKPGHKRGDPCCDLDVNSGSASGDQQKPEQLSAAAGNNSEQSRNSMSHTTDRGRLGNRAGTQSRSRSYTPKRDRSGSPLGTPTKMAKVASHDEEGQEKG